MKGQISRLTHNPAKRYAGVFLEMGRMVTDADDVERGQIASARLQALGNDTARSGAPVAGGAVDLSGGTPALREGVIYADGVRGELRAAGDFDAGEPLALYAVQADFPEAPPLAGPALVYADLWERPVFSIEDPSLVDPAFHGADTSFRTRIMTQIRLAPPGTTLGAGAFPPRGNAVLAAVLREEPEGPDPCDPCATELDLPVRTGDYLFRLEIVDVQGPADAPTGVRLLWSDENGAERFATAGPLPDDYEREGRLYEFYSEITEAHQGAFADPAARRRSEIRGEVPSPIPPRTDGAGAEPWPYVRRWDGGIDLDLAAGSATPVLLGPNEAAELAGGVLKLTLARIEVTLDLNGRALLPGDHWLVEVREFAPEADRVRVASPEPLGIVHHYLPLFEIDAAGAPGPLGDADRRRLSFPPLSDLPATHVGFTDNCPKLFSGAENVQQALDALCAIEAGDIGFDNNCPRLYGSGAEGATTVQEALDRLCETIQQGGGCSVTVGEEGGQFPDLMRAISTLLERGMRDICICLLPGDHKGSLALEEEDLRIEIHGCGRGASRLLLAGEGLKLNAETSVLSGLEITIAEIGAEIALVARSISLRDLSVRGLTRPETPALITVDALDRLTIEGCDLEAFREETFRAIGEVVEVAGIGREEAGLEIQALLFEARAARRKLLEHGRRLARTPPAERTRIARKVASLRDDLAGLTFLERQAIDGWAQAIGAEKASAPRITKGVDDLRAAAIRSRPGLALVIMSALADTILEDCRINGIARLYGPKEERPLNQDEAARLVGAFRPQVRPEDTRLAVLGCDLAQLDVDGALVAQLRAEIGNQTGRVIEGVFRFVEIRGTRFRATLERTAFTIVAERITVATSNLDPTPEAESGFVGTVVGLMSAYTGNFGGHNSARVMDVTVFVMEEAANVALTIQS